MPWRKRLLKAQATQAAAAWLLALYIRLVFLTSRVVRHIDPAAASYMQGKENGIFAFWHGRMMMMLAFTPEGRDMYVLSTPHRDGQLSSRVVRRFGNRTIYGSSSRGGHSAAREMLRALEQGGNICITPEGPRGPLQVAQRGTVAIAKLSGKPVLPVAFSSTRQLCFDSWDKFVLPLPFGRIEFCAGAPMTMARNADDEQARLAIERALNAELEKADRFTHA
ncbi:MAG: lysophospholipid acyltransferase family protein [Pseudomonadota bacterium]|nr:lysophospholipid acyltransferase family protein [Pseudomonadota bacterium]MDE3037350.1 lysophospholipid acyltransferase family protein [Pseudomonadota bacterium]